MCKLFAKFALYLVRSFARKFLRKGSGRNFFKKFFPVELTLTYHDRLHMIDIA